MEIVTAVAAGTVWQAIGNRPAADTGLTPGDYVAQMKSVGPERLTVVGTEASGGLVAAVGSVNGSWLAYVARPAATARSPGSLLDAARAEARTQHVFATIFPLCPVSRAGWNVVSGAFGPLAHPIAPLAQFFGISPDYLLEFVTRIRDPRWFRHNADDRVTSATRVFSYLRLHTRAGGEPARRARAAVASSCDPGHPRGMLRRIAASAKSADGELTAARVLAKALWLNWLAKLVHVELFDPARLFRRPEELAAWREVGGTSGFDAPTAAR